jgi:hypothetical protein
MSKDIMHMKITLFRLMAGIVTLFAMFGAPVEASAAANRVIPVTYCWSLTTFGPNACNSNWPTAPVLLTGGNNSGTAMGSGATGTYQFTNNKNKLTLTFVNPEANILNVQYVGNRYSGGGPNCYRGTMTADVAVGADATGVWFGCVQNQ